MNYIELQKMRKAAGLGWGWVNDLVGDDNIVSDVFGNNRQQRLDNYANQFRQQMNQDLGPATLQRQQQGAADWDRRVAEAGDRLDRALTATRNGETHELVTKPGYRLKDPYAGSRIMAENQKYKELYGEDRPTYVAALTERKTNEAIAQAQAAKQQHQVAANSTAERERINQRAQQEQAQRAAIAQQPQRNYQAFNRNNLSGYTQDQINAINAAAQKKGLKMGDITQVSFGNNGAVNGFRVRKGTLNKQPQNTAIANAPATQAPATRKI